MTVSVALATFNGERFLREQLASLAEQSHTPAELVVSDDGSSDRTLEIIESFARSAPFPVVVHQNSTRLGYKGNFMQAASLCRSEIISFCDQDDRWKSNKIAGVCAGFAEENTLLVYHNAEIVDERGGCIGFTSNLAETRRYPPMTSDPRSYSLGFTQSFRRSLLPFCRLWTAFCGDLPGARQIAHDQWFFFLASVFGDIVYLPDPVVYYRQHDANTFGVRPPAAKSSYLSKLLFPRSSFTYWEAAFAMRADILAAAMPELSGDWHARAEAAEMSYRALSKAYAERNILYTAPSIWVRFLAFCRLCRTNGYGANASQGLWAFGRKSLVKDICIAVPLGSRLSGRSTP